MNQGTANVVRQPLSVKELTASAEVRGGPAISGSMLWSLLLGCRPPIDRPVNVVIVVVDGVRVEESVLPDPSDLSGLSGPDHWPGVSSELVPLGSSMIARNAGTTVTAPAHAILATGARVPLGNMAVDEGVGLYRPDRPTLFEELCAQGAGTALVLANQSLIAPITWSTMPGYGEALGARWMEVVSEPGSDRPASEDSAVLSTLLFELDRSRPRLVLANLKAVDRAGHYGEDIDSYLEAVDKVDQPIVELWGWLQEHPFYADNTVLVVTSDHGRHRDGGAGGEEFWRNHGDASEGDRQVPLLLVGPGIEAGLQLDELIALADLVPTLGALLGVETPWAEGQVIDSILTGDSTPRTGAVQVAAAGRELLSVWQPEGLEQRSTLSWNGETVSDEQAWMVEAPVVVQDEGQAWACWRELHLGQDHSPWVPRCFESSGGSLRELPPPVDEVSALWRPQLRVSERGLELSFVDNPEDIAQPGIDGEVGPLWLRLEDGAWVEGRDPEPALRYPTDARTVDLSEDMLTVFIASPYSNDSRGERRPYSQRSRWIEDGFEVEAAQLLDLSSIEPKGEFRVEQPALMAEGAQVELLLVGLMSETRVLIQVSSEDGGQTWSEPALLADDPAIPAHLPPLWIEGEASWLRFEGGAQLCTPRGCEDLGVRAVKDWAWDGSHLQLVALSDQGDWGLVER